MFILYSTLLSFATAVYGSPHHHLKYPIAYDGSDVGVSFGGFHASAGLGGILSSGAVGGLHAEAGTPFGQRAAAGLGGVVSEGESAGGLYAAADSGAGHAAGTVLGGITGSAGISGSAAAVKGGTYVSKTVEDQHHIVIDKTVEDVPVARKTYIERTVIPNYVEKTIQVPTYVEKTIRVPTVVEKKIKVAAPPTIIEKTVNQPSEVIATGVVRKPYIHKSFVGGFGASAGGYNDHNYYGTGYGGSSAGLTYRKQVSSDLINDIFNIPISTLGAVSRLVGGIAGGTSGSLSVSKHIAY